MDYPHSDMGDEFLESDLRVKERIEEIQREIEYMKKTRPRDRMTPDFDFCVECASDLHRELTELLERCSEINI